MSEEHKIVKVGSRKSEVKNLNSLKQHYFGLYNFREFLVTAGPYPDPLCHRSFKETLSKL